MNVKILRMRWKMIRSGSFEPRKPVNKSNDEKEIRFQEIEAEEKFFKNEEPNGNQMETKWKPNEMNFIGGFSLHCVALG